MGIIKATRSKHKMTNKVLKLYNTFARTSKNVVLNGKLISVAKSQQPTINGSFYICGPTVYDDCHVGHALTYIRADLFRRFMKSIFNVRLLTVMNITDIDDKILNKTIDLNRLNGNNSIDIYSSQPDKHPFRKISDKYYRNFLRDLSTINVLPADIYVKISRHVNLITNFIRKLEQNGSAYIASNGDVHFRVNSIKNYVGRTDDRLKSLENTNLHESFDINNENIAQLNSSSSKEDRRDFVLWKAAKPNEPVWHYKSSLDKNKCIPGRPGWHVQCSAISSAIFGRELDFHFGGKDLIFPHHYNEQACCCAYHQLDTSKGLNVWTKHWLHSGHLVLRDSNEKMSKSLGNIVAIKNFISRSSVNALRLLCIATHYRTDVTYNEELLDKLKSLDHKLNAFYSYMNEELRHRQESLSNEFIDDYDNNNDNNQNTYNSISQTSCDKDIENIIEITHDSIIDGICDDFHLDKGLDSIINLSKVVYSKSINNIRTKNLLIIWSLLTEWCNTSGLIYGATKTTFANTSVTSNLMKSSSPTPDESLELLSDFRNKVRLWALKELKTSDSSKIDKLSLNDLMKECDNIRTKLNEFGFVPRDLKS